MNLINKTCTACGTSSRVTSSTPSCPACGYCFGLVSTRVVRFVSEVTDGVASDMSTCGAHGGVYENTCGCAREMRYVPIRCGDHKKCPVCSASHTKRRASIERSRFDECLCAVGSQGVMTPTFTLPSSMWDQYLLCGGVNREKFREFRSMIKDCLTQWVEPLVDLKEGERIELGIKYYQHFWHSDSPFMGVYPHIHCVVSDLIRIIRPSGLVRWERVSLFVSAMDIDYLHRIWSSIVGEKSVCDYRFVRMRQKGRWSHKFEYLSRYPIHDIIKLSSDGIDHITHSTNLVPALSPEGYKAHMDWIRLLLDGGGRYFKRVVNAGWLGDGVVSKRFKELKVKLPSLDDVIKAERKAFNRSRECALSCPHCGEPMELKEYTHYGRFLSQRSMWIEPWLA